MSADCPDRRELQDLSAASAAKVVGILDHYMEQMEEGQQPDADQLLARHPEFAEILKRYFQELDLLHRAASAGLGSALPDDTTFEVNGEQGRLGDFRLLREVGRGGMGIVYEAEQLSLSRRVALKVLPFAATLDAKQLLRFRNEARAAAHLHHPHIVPVYGVGCDRGVHYYAMQFIDGKNLAEIIADMKECAQPASPAAPAAPTVVGLSTLRSTNQPAFFRAIAEVGRQAAEALEYAHQLGIVHRDIKPANLLLDEAAHLWITDFGLARCRADQGLTQTGDAVGTLRYMSPEQALAKRGVVDHRCDIYCLGLTLYEALTLTPAYPADDREELLRQIASCEPVTPRRVNPAIPVQLETIVLKAMTPEPERRYNTAQEFAEDLASFLEHRPIRATRPSLRERALKWARRHQSVVGAAAAVLVLGVACLSVSMLLIWREKEATKKALLDAQAQSQRAKANFDKALSWSMLLMMRLEDKRWAHLQPVIKDLHRDVVDESLKFYREFLHEDSPDPTDRYETARLYEQIAGIHCYREEHEAADKLMNRATRLLEDLLAGDPGNSNYRIDLAKAYRSHGYKHWLRGQTGEAHESFVRAVQQFRLAVRLTQASQPKNDFAWLLATSPDPQTRDGAEAVVLAEQAVALEPQTGNFWNTLGAAHYRAGNWRAAITALQHALDLRSGGDGYDWFFLAMSYWRLGDKVQAKVWYDKGVKALETLRPEHDQVLAFKAEADVLFGIKKATP